jgi:PhnB protein
MRTTPYIFFDGTCAEALAFYENAIGAKVEAKMTYGETPAAAHVPPAIHKHIIHARLRVGESVILASDGTPDHPAGKAGRFGITLHATGTAEAERLFKALADGGTVTMKMDKTFFAERFGSAIDRYGIPWMVICEKEG